MPSQDFFRFCEEMLERYEDDVRIMHIGGDNFTNLGKGDFSYYFSDYLDIYGWATWKRAWAKYDFRMKEWQSFRKNLKKSYKTIRERFLFRYLFDSVLTKNKENWDYQWSFCLKKNKGLSVVPIKNLVTNIGLDVDSTNIIKGMYKYAMIPRQKLNFPLKHPREIKADRKNDLRHINWLLKWKARNLVLRMAKLDKLLFRK